MYFTISNKGLIALEIYCVPLKDISHNEHIYIYTVTTNWVTNKHIHISMKEIQLRYWWPTFCFCLIPQNEQNPVACDRAQNQTRLVLFSFLSVDDDSFDLSLKKYIVLTVLNGRKYEILSTNPWPEGGRHPLGTVCPVVVWMDPPWPLNRVISEQAVHPWWWLWSLFCILWTVACLRALSSASCSFSFFSIRVLPPEQISKVNHIRLLLSELTLYLRLQLVNLSTSARTHSRVCVFLFFLFSDFSFCRAFYLSQSWLMKCSCLPTRVVKPAHTFNSYSRLSSKWKR